MTKEEVQSQPRARKVGRECEDSRTYSRLELDRSALGGERPGFWSFSAGLWMLCCLGSEERLTKCTRHREKGAAEIENDACLIICSDRNNPSFLTPDWSSSGPEMGVKMSFQTFLLNSREELRQYGPVESARFTHETRLVQFERSGHASNRCDLICPLPPSYCRAMKYSLLVQ